MAQEPPDERRLPIPPKPDEDTRLPNGKSQKNAIAKQNFAVLGNRPAISKPRKLALVARAALGKLFGNLGSHP